jgi:hypothetical protein
MSFTDDRLVPAQEYHNRLMKQIDDAYWMGNDDDAKFFENEAEYVKGELDKGAVWLPEF